MATSRENFRCPRSPIGVKRDPAFNEDKNLKGNPNLKMSNDTQNRDTMGERMDQLESDTATPKLGRKLPDCGNRLEDPIKCDNSNRTLGKDFTREPVSQVQPQWLSRKRRATTKVDEVEKKSPNKEIPSDTFVEDATGESDIRIHRGLENPTEGIPRDQNKLQENSRQGGLDDTLDHTMNEVEDHMPPNSGNRKRERGLDTTELLHQIVDRSVRKRFPTSSPPLPGYGMHYALANSCPPTSKFSSLDMLSIIFREGLGRLPLVVNANRAPFKDSGDGLQMKKINVNEMECHALSIGLKGLHALGKAPSSDTLANVVGREIMSLEQFFATSLQRRKVLNRGVHERLLLLRHANACPIEAGESGRVECSVTPRCEEMRKLWKHMSQCRVQDCKYTLCIHACWEVRHLRSCKRHDCPLCEPVKSLIQRSLINNMDKGLHEGSKGDLYQQDVPIPDLHPFSAPKEPTAPDDPVADELSELLEGMDILGRGRVAIAPLTRMNPAESGGTQHHEHDELSEVIARLALCDNSDDYGHHSAGATPVYNEMNPAADPLVLASAAAQGKLPTLSAERTPTGTDLNFSTGDESGHDRTVISSTKDSCDRRSSTSIDDEKVLAPENITIEKGDCEVSGSESCIKLEEDSTEDLNDRCSMPHGEIRHEISTNCHNDMVTKDSSGDGVYAQKGRLEIGNMKKMSMFQAPQDNMVGMTTAVAAMTPRLPPSEPTAFDDKAAFALLQQQQLLVIFYRCIAQNTPRSKEEKEVMEEAKKLWNHLVQQGHDSICKSSLCTNSYILLSHFYGCKHHRCEVCSPVRQLASWRRLERGLCLP